MRSVFISYRREDAAGEARALFEHLTSTLGQDAVFMDVDTIALGRDFRDAIHERLSTCDVMLVLVGKDWMNITAESGGRRLDNPGDYVRLEIEAAMRRQIPVTPVLVQGARMPTAEQLPNELQPLAFRNGFELSHTRWDSDVRELMNRLDLKVPASVSPEVKPAAPRSLKWRLGAAVAAVLLIGTGIALYEGDETVDQGEAGSLPSNTEQWLSAQEYQQDFDRHVAQGEFPAAVQGRLRDGAEEYHADWTSTANQCEFEAHHGLAKTEFDDRNAQLEGESYSLQSVSNFVGVDGEAKYQAVWSRCPSSPDK